MSDDVVAILQRAKERVAAGWCQGRLSDHVQHPCAVPHPMEALRASTEWCVSGALIAELGQWLNVRSPHPVEVALAAVIGEDFVAWNDTPGRTQAELLDAFDAAIRLAKDSA